MLFAFFFFSRNRDGTLRGWNPPTWILTKAQLRAVGVVVTYLPSIQLQAGARGSIPLQLNFFHIQHAGMF